MPLNEIVSYLLTKYQPKAIILHGSRVREDALKQSDYDLILISEYPDSIRAEYYDDQALDISGILPTTIILKSANTPLWPCQVLFDDKDGLGMQLAKQTHEAFLKGPSPLTQEEWENRCNFSRRLIGRIQERGHDPLVRSYYVGDFYQRALRYWCETNQKWTMSIHRLLPIIAKDDPIFYKALQNLWAENYQAALLKIHTSLFSDNL